MLSGSLNALVREIMTEKTCYEHSNHPVESGIHNIRTDTFRHLDALMTYFIIKRFCQYHQWILKSHSAAQVIGIYFRERS